MKTLKTLSVFLLVSLLIIGCNDGSQKTRVLMDSDANNELDDQHAIAYMLFNGNHFDVEGITVNRTVNGGDVVQHFKEAERVVKLCDLYPEISIYKGANGSFEEIKDNVSDEEFDGVEAVDFIIEQAKIESDRRLVLLPIGKLTNIALALHKDPSIASNIRIVWLGSNYPDPGEYNQVNDESALSYLLEVEVDFEIVLVRYGKDSGTDAVRAYLSEIEEIMPGKGPQISEPVIGRHGKSFTNFGDYSVNLFKNIELDGNPPSRALFDMAAVAILKNSNWAQQDTIGAPRLENGEWIEQPDNPRKIVLWENFDTEKIMRDFYESMNNYHLAGD